MDVTLTIPDCIHFYALLVTVFDELHYRPSYRSTQPLQEILEVHFLCRYSTTSKNITKICISIKTLRYHCLNFKYWNIQIFVVTSAVNTWLASNITTAFYNCASSYACAKINFSFFFRVSIIKTKITVLTLCFWRPLTRQKVVSLSYDVLRPILLLCCVV